jgi:hypothetical protein
MSSAPIDNSSIDVVTMTTLELANQLEPFLNQLVFIGSLSPWFLLSEGFIGRTLEEGEAPPMVPTGPQVSNDIEIAIAIDLKDPNLYPMIVKSLHGYTEMGPKSGKFSRPHKNKSKMIVDLIPLIESGTERPDMPTGMNRTDTEILFRQSKTINIHGFDFQGRPKTYKLTVAKLSTFVLFRTYLFAQRKDPRYITELCYALEFLDDGPVRAADELKPFAKSLWVRDGIQRLRSLFVDIDADGPTAYAKEHGVSMAAAVKFRKAQGFELVKRFLKRTDGAVEDF